MVRCSQTTILGMVVVVAGVVSSIFVLKWFLLKPPQDRRVALAGMPLGGIIASFANAVQIQVPGETGTPAHPDHAAAHESWFAGLCACVVVQVTNALYQNLALWLTDLENHRTETAYEDSLIAKTFLFQVRPAAVGGCTGSLGPPDLLLLLLPGWCCMMMQFVNSYASLVYIAFAKQYLEGCTPDCMAELGTTLGTIFITR